MAKKKKKSSTRSRKAVKAPDATGKHLVIVESPAKARTINKYLGNDYVVLASVGHVRDLPSRPPKGAKRKDHPVPGVDLENNFAPTYEVMTDKKSTVTQLKKAAKQADDVWFATDLDREGEAIAWHLAQALGVPEENAKRVVFNAITKREIENAFDHPRPLDINKVNAQQARRILDRIVGYQVSPLLWKKVAGGLSAGRVQSVALRLVVEREREIDAFVPDEFWKVNGYFTVALDEAPGFRDAWAKWLAEGLEAARSGDGNGNGNGNGKRNTGRTIREKNAWLNDHRSISAELIEFNGDKFEPKNLDDAKAVFDTIGFVIDDTLIEDDPKGKGPAAKRATVVGHLADPQPDWAIESIKTKRNKSRPYPPFITSTLQQAAANQLGFPAQMTMRLAQQLYEGVEVKGQGSMGLITYMRTDSTHLSNEAIDAARGYIGSEFGDDYLPEKPNFYKSSNKSAQEAHEAIRPTSVTFSPKSVKSSLTDAQYKLYDLIWRRFVACQMTPAVWDSTTVRIKTQNDNNNAVFKCTGRTLVFDGFYKVVGIPKVSDELVLPPMEEGQNVAALQIDPRQHFTAAPPRYTEASLVKKLEAEGIGRPSTYASIIQVIQDRKYVEKMKNRFYATDLGCVVWDKLDEAFPRVMDVAYTREMETELDEVETERHDWVEMLRQFYGPFKQKLEKAYEGMTHAKAETQPAPHKCDDCGADTVYRFGKNGRFLSCSRYPDCKYAAPIDREGNPVGEQFTDIQCPICQGRMTKRTGRFGPFLGCENYPECKGILNLDPRKGVVKLPKPPPLETDVPCAKCEEGVMNLRTSKRGPWLSCNRFPKCRGRVAWSSLDEAKQKELTDALEKHEAANPVPVVKNTSGNPIGDAYTPTIDGQGDDDTSDASYDDAA